MQFAGVQTNFGAPPCALGSRYRAAPLMHFEMLTACVPMRLGRYQLPLAEVLLIDMQIG